MTAEHYLALVAERDRLRAALERAEKDMRVAGYWMCADRAREAIAASSYSHSETKQMSSYSHSGSSPSTDGYPKLLPPLPAEEAQMLLKEIDELKAFIRRIAEYDDYTHDDVDEVKILHDLQREALQLL